MLLLKSKHSQRCHPERSRGTSPTWVTCSALARSLRFGRDDMAMLGVLAMAQYLRCGIRLRVLKAAIISKSS